MKENTDKEFHYNLLTKIDQLIKNTIEAMEEGRISKETHKLRMRSLTNLFTAIDDAYTSNYGEVWGHENSNM